MKPNRRRAAAAAAFAAAALLAACSPSEPGPQTAGAAAAAQPGAVAIEVTDDAGRVLRLVRPARRIVAVSPHITELLFAAGAGAAVVGVDAWSDHPEAARALPRVGDLHALDLERIVALAPDLIVVWGHGNSQRQLEVLAALGLPIYVDEPRRLADIPRSLERLGRLAGHAESASAVATQLRRELQALGDQARLGQSQSASGPGRAASPVPVFYQVWDQPLLTVSDQTLIGDVIRLCGGRNVFGQLPMQAPQVGVEAVIEADPAVIVAARFGATPGADATASAATRASVDDPAFATWRRWPRLRAVREGRLVSLPDDLISRHGPRIVEGARLLCEALDTARAPGG